MYEVGEVWKVNGGVSQKFESDKDNRRTRKTVRRAGREGESRPGQGRAEDVWAGLWEETWGDRLGALGWAAWVGVFCEWQKGEGNNGETKGDASNSGQLQGDWLER